MNEHYEQEIGHSGVAEEEKIYVPVLYDELVDLIIARTERDVILVVAENADYSFPLQDVLKAIVALHSPDGEAIEPDDEGENDNA